MKNRKYEYKFISLYDGECRFKKGSELLQNIIEAGLEGWVWQGNDYGRAILVREIIEDGKQS